VDYEKLSGDRVGESSEAIRGRVQVARDTQNKRFSSNGSSDIVCNADMRVGEVRQFCKLHDEGAVLTVRLSLTVSKHQSLMRAAMSQLNLSARAYQRTRSLKLTRTIADLAGSEEIQSAHLGEALHASQSSKDHDGVIFYPKEGDQS
jgi:magnesium chelatase family protein